MDLLSNSCQLKLPAATGTVAHATVQTEMSVIEEIPNLRGIGFDKNKTMSLTDDRRDRVRPGPPALANRGKIGNLAIKPIPAKPGQLGYLAFQIAPRDCRHCRSPTKYIPELYHRHAGIKTAGIFYPPDIA